MIGLRLAVFLFFLGPILGGFGLCVSARAQDAPLRAEIEVNTTVLDELEGYNPPPMFGTPDRPVLSRPIERLAFPARAAQPDTHNLKKKAEKDGFQLARPIIEDAPRGASAVPKAPAPDRFAAQKPESDEPRDRIAAPVPTPKPQIAASESSKLAAAAPVPPPSPRRASQAAPASPRAAESNIVKSSARDAQRPPLSRAPAKLAENTESASSPRPPAAPVETSVENPALMPAMPTPAVMRQALATGQNADPPRTPAPPVSGENLLSAPETPLPAAAEALAGLEPAAGEHDITAYEPPEASVVPVSADISAGPALKRPDAVPDDTRERS